MTAKTKTVYEEWREARAQMESLYEKVAAEKGRLKIGPSGASGGVYINAKMRDGQNGPEAQISNISEDEARFVVLHLIRIFGLHGIEEEAVFGMDRGRAK